MKLKDLREINDLLAELWDFFTSNCDVDGTGLVEEAAPKMIRVKEAIGNEFYKLHLRNELNKVKRKLKQQ